MEPIVKLAAEVADAAAPHAQRHDAEGSFVTEGCRLPGTSVTSPRPCPSTSAGGAPAPLTSPPASRSLGAACGSTALATAMHQHVVLAAAWRWRRGDTVVEPLLRKVADGLVVASTGGRDWTHPRPWPPRPTAAGVSGRKTFASLAPWPERRPPSP